MSLIDNFRYRPEIDGLRAIAVGAVVLFHAGFGCSGGFVGVDVFFVISGFLITSLIWKDLESGRFSFANFWERRARRIVPAAVVVTLATLIVGWFLLLPLDFKLLGEAAVAQATFSANIYYWLHTGYFAGAAEEMPLLHTWTLAVEEQFYFIVPFLLWAMFRFVRLRTRTSAFLMLAAGFFISFATSIYGVSRFPSATFYLLPTRVWELLFGSLVAFLPAMPSLLNRQILRELSSLVGLALILIPIFFYTPHTPFPGLTALPPCLGAVLLIWSNSQMDNSAPTTVGALLSIRPMVFVGLISYSLYLWHWPFLAFSKYLAIVPSSSAHRALMVVLAFVCAVLSWKYVETPFRNREWGVSRKTMFAYAGVGLMAVLCGGLLCIKMQGFPQRFPAQAQKFAEAKADMAFINELTTEDILEKKLVQIGAMNSALQPTFLVWGDSHAMAALPAFDAFLKEKGLSGLAATHSATAPVLNWSSPDAIYGLDSLAFNDAIFSYIQSQNISVVVISARWTDYIESDEGNSFDSALLTTIQRLVELGSRPWILLDVPSPSFDVPKVLSRSAVSHENIDYLFTKPTERNARYTKLLGDIEAAGGQILDPMPRFLDQTGEHYIVQVNGVALYRDGHHLTTKGAKLMLLPLLRDSLTIENK